MASYLTAADEQNYGAELLDVTKRAALDVVVPHIQHLEAQNNALQRRLQRESRARLDQQVAMSVPNFREIDKDPRWHRWLAERDPHTGRSRQVFLNEAISQGDGNRVINGFFRKFQQEVGSGAYQAAPSASGGWGRQSGRPTYTRADIARFYELVRTGAFTGREADKDAIEQDIFLAQREGRIQAAPYLTK
jgi:hypothetical protein